MDLFEIRRAENRPPAIGPDQEFLLRVVASVLILSLYALVVSITGFDLSSVLFLVATIVSLVLILAALKAEISEDDQQPTFVEESILIDENEIEIRYNGVNFWSSPLSELAHCEIKPRGLRREKVISALKKEYHPLPRSELLVYLANGDSQAFEFHVLWLRDLKLLNRVVPVTVAIS